MISIAAARDVAPVRQVERRRRRRRGLAVMLASLAVAGVGSSALSLALFSDNDAAAWSFGTGTIDIASSPSVLTSVSAMMPGDTSTQSLTVQNAGTATFRYSLSTVATNVLGDDLLLEVKTAGSGCGAFDGTTLVASTALDGAGFGDPTPGADTGDRTLAGGASEALCFRVSLPLSAPNALQGATSAATFSFDAEQTANNP